MDDHLASAREASLLPPNTRDLIYSKDSPLAIYGGNSLLAPHAIGDDDRECAGAAFHSPRPLFVRQTPLVLLSWWSGEQHVPASAPTAPLCGTCRDNLSILLQMLHATNGDLPWAVRREFGNSLRALAVKGWAWFEATHRTKEKS